LDWQAIIEWSGYDFVGVIISLFGGVYAFIANKNAKKASLIAAKAVSNVMTFDTVTELSKMLNTTAVMGYVAQIQRGFMS
jgi:hypothetical protein